MQYCPVPYQDTEGGRKSGDGFYKEICVSMGEGWKDVSERLGCQGLLANLEFVCFNMFALRIIVQVYPSAMDQDHHLSKTWRSTISIPQDHSPVSS